MKTFSKRGDEGETDLLYGERTAKSDLRCEAYGTIDEAVSALGLARQFCAPEIGAIIQTMQKELFMVGAELAVTREHYAQFVAEHVVITVTMANRLENLIKEYEAKITMPQDFIIPGGAGTGSAALDLARAIVRRAERRIIELKQSGMIGNENLLKYLNRLSDLIFTLARYQETREKSCK